MKILILFTELAEYIMACVNTLAEHSDARIQIIRLPVNKEAPFRFSYIHPNITLQERTEFSDKQLVDVAMQFSPDLVICSGWNDKAYLSICSHFYDKVPTVLIFDNKWRNTLRQNMARVASPLMLKTRFSHCFVPGPEQKKFARKLGFPDNRILTGLYACDYRLFSGMYNPAMEIKSKKMPHRFLYVGRYLSIKGPQDLWQAFAELKAETGTDWELWCVGQGDLQPPESQGIRHFGFVQPRDLQQFVNECAVCVMPSHKDAWGVALQEMCAAGMPVVVSNSVGAAVTFYEKEKNGFMFPAGNVSELKKYLKKCTALSDAALLEMGKASHSLSASCTPEKWADNLLQLIHVRN